MEGHDSARVDAAGSVVLGAELQDAVRAPQRGRVRIHGCRRQHRDEVQARHGDAHPDELARGAEGGRVHATHAHLRVDQGLHALEGGDARNVNLQALAECHQLQDRPARLQARGAHDAVDLDPLAVVLRQDRGREPDGMWKPAGPQKLQPRPDDDRGERAPIGPARHLHGLPRAHVIEVAPGFDVDPGGPILDEKEVAGRVMSGDDPPHAHRPALPRFVRRERADLRDGGQGRLRARVRQRRVLQQPQEHPRRQEQRAAAARGLAIRGRHPHALGAHAKAEDVVPPDRPILRFRDAGDEGRALALDAQDVRARAPLHAGDHSFHGHPAALQRRIVEARHRDRLRLGGRSRRRGE
jgi:hypothetical protein